MTRWHITLDIPEPHSPDVDPWSLLGYLTDAYAEPGDIDGNEGGIHVTITDAAEHAECDAALLGLQTDWQTELGIANEALAIARDLCRTHPDPYDTGYQLDRLEARRQKASQQ